MPQNDRAHEASGPPWMISNVWGLVPANRKGAHMAATTNAPDNSFGRNMVQSVAQCFDLLCSWLGRWS